MKLDADTIVAEAIDLLNSGGLAEVSLRKIAARLGVAAPSLAWHVGDKDQLLAMMAARIFRTCLEAISPAADWQDWARQFGLVLWDGQVRTRDLTRLIASAPRREEINGVNQTILDTQMRAVGLDPIEDAPVQFSIQALVTGWSAFREAYAAHGRTHTVLERRHFEQALDALIAGWAARRAKRI